MTSMSADLTASKITRKRPKLSCNPCRLSRRKCDRADPCRRCQQLKIECTFHPSRQSLSRRRDGATTPLDITTTTISSPRPVSTDTPISSTGSSSRHRHNLFSSSSIPTDSTTYSTPQHEPALISAPQRNGLPPVKNPPQSLKSLLCHVPFLAHCFEVLFNSHDSSTHLLEGTRIHHLSKNSRSTGVINESTDEFDPLYVLSLVIVCLVAQMEPTTIQSALILLPSPLRKAWPLSVHVEVAAYNQSRDLFDRPSITPSKWTAEHFAASMVLRLYEKQAGQMDRCNEGVLINAAKTQTAGLHRWPRTQRSSSFIDKQIGYISEEDRLLSYRVFWEAFDKERVSCWYNGWGYSIRSEQSNLCLRDPFGHATIKQLSDCHARDPLEYDEASQCICLQNDNPRLSAYAGAHARIGALCGKLYDRMGKMRKDSRLLDEKLAEDFARFAADSLTLLEDRVVKCAESNLNLMSQAQADAILLIIAQIRCGIARRLFEVYAARLQEKGQSSRRIEGLVKRRELDAAINLIDRAAQMTSKAQSASINRIIMPKFIHQQIIELLNSLSPWFQHRHDHGISLEGESEETKMYLLHCLYKALLGRNLLVLLARKSDLRHVQDLLEATMSQLNRFLDKLISQETLLQCCDSSKLIDEQSILEEVQSYQRSKDLVAPALHESELAAPLIDSNAIQDSNNTMWMNWDSVFPDPAPLLFSEEEMMSVFADLPELQQLMKW